MTELSPNQIKKLLDQFLATRSLAEHQQLLKQNPDFLTAEFSTALAQLAEKQTDKQAQQQLTFFQEILHNCREQGIEHTFAELEQHFTAEPLTQLVDQVLQAQSPHDIAELAQNHPELLSDNTTKLIAHIITEARQKNQADLAEALEQRHAPLRQLQTATATHITLNTMMFQYVVRRVRQ